MLPADNRYVVYRWLTSDEFLVARIVPDATVIEAAVDDELEAILAKVPADARSFQFHLNCTITDRFPQCRNELISRLSQNGIRVINGNLTDISKRTIQQRCASLGLNTTAAMREGDPDELIILKTDLNFGGDSEWALSDAERSKLGLGEGSTLIYRPDHYQVVPRKDMEPSWWTDPSLVCEKFIDNRDNRWYRAVMLFSRLVLRELINPAQIKKVGQSEIVGQWTIDTADPSILTGPEPVPTRIMSDLIQFMSAFKMDFGAIDIMVNDAGDPFIIDVNSTPALHIPQPALVDHLRGALSTSSS
jgi:hypothetical protein